MTHFKFPLGQLCDVRIGRTPRRDSPQYWGGSAVWITVRELGGGVLTDSKEHISDLAVKEVMPSPVPAGTLLFSFKLSIGKMAVAGVPLYTNEAIAALIIRKPERLDQEFLRYALMTCGSESGANHAVLGKVLNKEKVEAIEIPAPPLPEQRRIVDLLSRAEGIVRLRREAEKKAAALIPALFLDMFGDPATNPKGWPMRPLRELVAFMSGGTPSKAREDYWEGDLPWVSPKDMKRMGIMDAIDHVNRKVLTETNIKLVPVGSLLIVVRGMILIHTVPVALSLIPLTINQDMKALVLHSDINSNYLLWLMQVLRPQLLNLVSTAAHGTKKLETESLERLPISLPPIEKQEAFAYYVGQIEGIQTQQSAATAKAQAAFDAILAQTFFTGIR